MIDIILAAILISFVSGFLLGGTIMIILTASRYKRKEQLAWEASLKKNE